MIIVQHNLLSKKEYLYRKYIYNIISIYIRFITKTIFMQVIEVGEIEGERERERLPRDCFEKEVDFLERELYYSKFSPLFLNLR